MNSLMNVGSPYISTNFYDPTRLRVDSYNKISNFLYLGNIDSLKHQEKFHLIVNCTKHIPLATKCKETIQIAVYDHFTECDNMIVYMNYTNVLERIHNCRMNKKPVLIHCHAGMQRSAAIVACYLIRFYNMTPDEAIRFIKSKRPIAFYPQANFMKVIQNEYQKFILK
jgi:protein tyrosine/serine phosphatase